MGRNPRGPRPSRGVCEVPMKQNVDSKPDGSYLRVKEWRTRLGEVLLSPLPVRTESDRTGFWDLSKDCSENGV